MEQTAPNPTKVATKWAVIYALTAIVITYIFQFANIPPDSPAKWLGYIPFIAFLLLAQKEYRDQLGGYITFGQGFSTGFRYALFGGLIMALFTFIYLKFLSPEILVQSMESQRDKMANEQHLSQEQIDKAIEIGTKYGAIIGAFAVAVGAAIFGAIVALIGAAIFKKERSPFETEEYTEPTV